MYAYLIAKHEGGDFLLRIEDTDQEREVEGAVDIIRRTLEETGLFWDEGPDNPGSCGPYVQSERVKTGIYMQYAKELVEKGEAYYCFCDKNRLESLQTEVNGEILMHYDKHCLSLSKEEVEEKLAAGLPYVIRQNNPTEGTTTFHDELYGDVTVDNAELDDMVLIKSDGFPTYNFANVVDDHLMGITHVVRGNEYLSSSPKYQRLYDAFGWESPKLVHCPLITDENHKKLSKRSGHSSFEDLIDQGFVPEAVVNFVALLGWSPEGNEEILSLQDLVREFDYHRISKSPAVFDMGKLRWMKEAAGEKVDLKKIAEMVKSRIEIFPDIPEHVDFFKAVPDYSLELYQNKKAKTNLENSLSLLKEVLPLLEKEEDYSNDRLYSLLQEFSTEKEYKTGFTMWPIRIALSGKQMTPAGATEILSVLGKEESLKRLKAAVERLEANT